MTYPRGNITSSLETAFANQRFLCQSMTYYYTYVNKMDIGYDVSAYIAAIYINPITCVIT